MQEGKASETAVGTAIQRAAHQILDEDPKILSDPVAVGLVPGSSLEDIRADEEKLQHPIHKNFRAALVQRSHFTEEALHEAINDGVRQYLILGAGFDTFAYRQPSWASELTIVEVDHPASQEFKRDCLDKAGVVCSENVSFCPVDFEQMSLREGLASSPFDPQAYTFVCWLGVTPYLNRAAIEETLHFVLSFSPPSRLAFSFNCPVSSLSGFEREALEVLSAHVEERGEPFLSQFEVEEMRQWLYDLGFSHVSHLSSEVARKLLFHGRTDGLSAPTWQHVMCAHV